MATSDNSLPTSELLSELLSVDLFEKAALLPVFRCVKCNEFLLPPIQLVAGLGNVCRNCNFNDTSVTTLHNEPMEVILQNLPLPCPNKSKGCTSICNYYEVSSHLEKCPSRDLQCLFSDLKNCKWKGGLECIFDHCCAEHPELVLETKNNSFAVNVNISTTNMMLKLLKIHNYQLILHISCDQQTSSLFYQIGCMSNIDNEDNFSVTINHLGKNGIYLPFELKKIIPYKNFSCNAIEKDALRIDLSCFEQFHFESVEAVIKITHKNRMEDIDESMLSVLECPICISYMKPPIFQCLAGHSLCCNCRHKLNHCPTCCSGFGSTRNYSLETLFSRARFPCQYQDQGCQTIMLGSELIKHELQCKVKPQSCLFLESNRCTWKGTYDQIVNHLIQTHGDKTTISNCVKIVLTFHNSPAMNCLIYNGIVFRISHKVDREMNTISWDVQYVGSKDDLKQFKLEIVLVDPKNKHNKLIRTGLCQELTSYKNLFKNCIVLPLNIISTYGYQYSCKITKIIP